MDDLTLRAPTPADVPGLAVLVARSFDTYRSFVRGFPVVEYRLDLA